MTPEETKKLIETVIETKEDDPALRYMQLYHYAQREGLQLALIVFPKEAGNRTLNSLRMIGEHPADLNCSLDIVEGYINGYGWRQVPREEGA